MPSAIWSATRRTATRGGFYAAGRRGMPHECRPTRRSSADRWGKWSRTSHRTTLADDPSSSAPSLRMDVHDRPLVAAFLGRRDAVPVLGEVRLAEEEDATGV